MAAVSGKSAADEITSQSRLAYVSLLPNRDRTPRATNCGALPERKNHKHARRGQRVRDPAMRAKKEVRTALRVTVDAVREGHRATSSKHVLCSTSERRR